MNIFRTGFPYGNAALSILVLAVVSGIALAFEGVKARETKQHPTLVYWTFSKEHYDANMKALPAFEKAHPGVTVEMQVVSNDAFAARLQAAFLAGLDVPDMCDMEIGSAGTMFRGPVKDVGFIDLKPRLVQSGLYDRMVAARFAPYTSRGHIFGMPQDVHPVQLAYRRDLFEKYGIDASKLKTWDEFIAAGRKVTIPGKRYMIELSDSDVSAGGLETMLLQRGGGYFDPAGHVIMDNDTAVQAMEFYVPLVAGPNKIGFTVGDMWGAQFTKAVEDGVELSIVCPDWRSKMVQELMGPLDGKMALMPLPAVYAGGRNTSTWGGTMLGITKRCKHPDLAWELAQYLFTDPAHLEEGFNNTNILPPLKSAWTSPIYQKPRKFWSGQPIGALYAKLAPEVPPQYTAPEIDTAKDEMAQALIACVKYYNQHGDDPGFDPFVRRELTKDAARVRAIQARMPAEFHNN